MDHRHSEPDSLDEIGPLTDAVITGLATDEERVRLDQLVTESEEARWAYVRYVHDTVSIHRRLQENRFVDELRSPRKEEALRADPVGHEARLEDLHGSLAFLSALADEGVPYVLHSHLSSPLAVNRRRPWSRVRQAAGWVVAGCLMIMMGILMGYSWSGRGARLAKSPLSGSRVAKIIHSTETAWLHDGIVTSLSSGDWLRVGRYTLNSGLVKIVFPWGTEATLEGPAELEFTSDGIRQLWHGQLVAKVPPQDTGFTISTPTMKLIDLGTEFGLSTDLNGESEVHVFKGAVEVRPHDGGDGTRQKPITLLTGEANGFPARESPVRQVAFNPKRFSRAWRMNSRVANTTGAMHFVHPPPPSVVEGQSETNHSLLLFLEREDQTLPSRMAVSITEPGLYTTFNHRHASLPAGVHVDSYLVHFDPVGSMNNQPPLIVEGAVTFDKPILAIIARGDQLAASDEWLACPETHYQGTPTFRQRDGESFSANITPAYAIRGLSGLWNIHYSHESPAPNDWLRLSADRRTLTVRCAAGGEADQLRILVSADGEEHSALAAPPLLQASQPFYGRPFAVGETIEAEDFDLGGQDVAYYDTTPDSLSNVYRTSESVELKQYLIDERRDISVSVVRAGEWLAYSIDIERPGGYVLLAHCGSQLRGGKFRFEVAKSPVDQPVVTPSLIMPTTPLEAGDREEWYATVVSEPVVLPAGPNILRVIMETNHTKGRLGNFDWFRIEPATAPSKE